MPLPLVESGAISHCIGSVIALIIIIITSIHILYHYIDKFCKLKSEQSKINYILFLLMCLFYVFPVIDYGLVRNNFLTHQRAHSFTEFQCSIAFFSTWMGIDLGGSIAYAMAVYRIQSVFENSCYVYAMKTYVSLYAYLVASNIVAMIMIWLPYSATQYIVYYFDHKDHVYCGVSINTDQDEDKMPIIHLIGNILYGVSIVVYGIIIISMFTQRLHRLKCKLVEIHLANRSRKSMSQKNDEDNGPPVTMRVISVSIEADEHNNESAKEILKLHNLIKRHTILVLTIVISNIVYICLVFSSAWFVMQYVWIVIINIMCTWLMFSVSDTYWNIATKYCCCYLCYCYKKRDINAKTCLLLC